VRAGVLAWALLLSLGTGTDAAESDWRLRVYRVGGLPDGFSEGAGRASSATAAGRTWPEAGCA